MIISTIGRQELWNQRILTIWNLWESINFGILKPSPKIKNAEENVIKRSRNLMSVKISV